MNEEPEVVLLRHAGTGTPCAGPYCEECLVQDALTGNLYYLVPRKEAT